MALFLIAQIAGRPVAIESSQVESVVDIGTVIPVPRAERQVRGLAALRSRVVTVIDTRAALGLDAAEVDAGRAIITIVEGHYYAILVDALDDVAPFELAPLSAGILLDKGWLKVGRGIVEREGEPILAIALDGLIPGALALAA
ncbi:MAG: chemotaxis protein CheW [Sphingomonas sp.]|jgi:purine-binding chemotaxis protein CheW|uniref:chemotaxis protein CheW n=1 Tax=unclassified Sphingomonas TaxID=196159 RepID=UPI00053DDE9B|nr:MULTISPECIES: chemotaxis protein CheW [unclassified Sphingomonas]MDR6849160.1 purine-binding chemotaxis protein CheW [Sphingomonas sp. BE137]MDR7259421.1 purine-binding chemotaxis protein CheW [Sphingomonas sp. BE270]RUN77186.1 chemotaxis protein CheW [Sphingomonas sp. TF3]